MSTHATHDSILYDSVTLAELWRQKSEQWFPESGEGGRGLTAEEQMELLE